MRDGVAAVAANGYASAPEADAVLRTVLGLVIAAVAMGADDPAPPVDLPAHWDPPVNAAPPPPVNFLGDACACLPPVRQGLFTNVELAAVFPQVRTRRGSDRTSEDTDFDLDANVQPTFTVGYAFDGGLSSVFASYRYLGTEGHPTVVDFGVGTARTRLDLNDFVWAYRRRFEPTRRWYWSLDAGARLSTLYYDLNINSQIATIAAEPFTLEARGSSQFVGAGPTVGVGSGVELRPGLTVFGLTDFSALFGRQTFRTAFQTTFDSDTFFEADTTRNSLTVKVLRAQAGFGWQPASTPHMQFQAGYQFEYWWDIGQFFEGNDDLLLNGVFLRLCVTY